MGSQPPPYFWKPWMSPYVAAGAFFFQKNDPLILGVTHKWIWIWIYPVCDSMGYPVNKGEGYLKGPKQGLELFSTLVFILIPSCFCVSDFQTSIFPDAGIG